MKMQIWKIWVTEGVMAAVHGSFYSIYEAFVPDLKLTVNQASSFVHDGEITRYRSCARVEGEPPIMETPDPVMICEFELSNVQIEDLKILANPNNNPLEKIQEVIASALKEHNIDSSDYEDED